MPKVLKDGLCRWGVERGVCRDGRACISLAQRFLVTAADEGNLWQVILLQDSRECTCMQLEGASSEAATLWGADLCSVPVVEADKVLRAHTQQGTSVDLLNGKARLDLLKLLEVLVEPAATKLTTDAISFRQCRLYML